MGYVCVFLVILAYQVAMQTAEEEVLAVYLFSGLHRKSPETSAAAVVSQRVVSLIICYISLLNKDWLCVWQKSSVTISAQITEKNATLFSLWVRKWYCCTGRERETERERLCLLSVTLALSSCPVRRLECCVLHTASERRPNLDTNSEAWFPQVSSAKVSSIKLLRLVRLRIKRTITLEGIQMKGLTLFIERWENNTEMLLIRSKDEGLVIIWTKFDWRWFFEILNLSSLVMYELL